MAQSITSTAGLTWPAEDFSRVPYGVFTSQQVCELMGYDANGGGEDMTTYVSKTEELTAFLNEYIHCIDDDRLEEWPEFFEDVCVYKIIPRENTELNLPIALVYCDNKGMLIDRVVSLRKANVYNLHYDRHIVSNLLVSDGDDNSWNLKANYIVYQTDLEGESMLFSTGKYDAVVVKNGTDHKFKEMIVTVDTYAVPNLISTPL